MAETKKTLLPKELLKQVKSKEGITECIRCCTCCAKGGPALHLEDKELIETGKLHGKFMYTIREGEPAEDNVKGGLIFTESDVIKIKSKENSDSCLYVDLNHSTCSIYENRPLECRVLKCWDTKEIEAIYNKDRLTRKDIIGHIPGLWEIIEEHQEKCSFAKIKKRLDQNPGELAGDDLNFLLEAVQYDISMRTLLIEKTNTDSNLLLFLLGKPLQDILKKFGFELKKRNQG